MPQYIKGMATVGIWGLFVGGWLIAANNFIFRSMMAGYAWGDVPGPMAYYVDYAIAIGFAFAGGFMMLVRKKLE